MSKVVVVNGAWRKGWNTDLMLDAAARGAQEAGADVERVNLYDLSYTGCRGCLGCCVKGSQTVGHCIVPDDLKPVLASIDTADGLIIGSPIFFSDISAQTRAFFERLIFQYMNYEGGSFYAGALKVGCIYTMNGTDEYYSGLYARYAKMYGMYFDYVDTVSAEQTLQANDYSRYYLYPVEAQRKQRREEVFPRDLERAFALGRAVAGAEA